MGTDDRLLVLNPELVRTGVQTFWIASEGREFTLGRASISLAYQFSAPTTVAVVTSALDAGPRVAITEGVELLQEKRVLIPHTLGGRPRVGPGGMFRSPLLSIDEALRGSVADVIFFGVPYDVGTTYHPGTRFGPEYLRKVSGSLFQYADGSDGPHGMYDPVRQRKVLSGVRIADIGDVPGTVFTRNGEAFAATEQITKAIALAGRFPVMLGGDHSLSLPAIRGILEAHPRLGVLHFDAHADYGAIRSDDFRIDCHHGNFMGWVIGDDRVERVAQFGVRQLTPDMPEYDSKVVRWGGRSALAAGLDTVLAQLPPELPYYITVDVDVIDPSIIPSTGTPLPGGFSHADAISLLEGICDNRRIVGMDIVELIVHHSDGPGLVAADMVLRVADSATSSSR